MFSHVIVLYREKKHKKLFRCEISAVLNYNTGVPSKMKYVPLAIWLLSRGLTHIDACTPFLFVFLERFIDNKQFKYNAQQISNNV